MGEKIQKLNRLLKMRFLILSVIILSLISLGFTNSSQKTKRSNAMFNIYDSNHDKLVTAREIQLAVSRYGQNLNINQAIEMIKYVDLNGDMKLNSLEFNKFFRTHKDFDD